MGIEDFPHTYTYIGTHTYIHTCVCVYANKQHGSLASGCWDMGTDVDLNMGMDMVGIKCIHSQAHIKNVSGSLQVSTRQDGRL